MSDTESTQPELPERTRSRWFEELGLALEVAALAAFTFSRPVLDSFGRSPETFIARHATTSDIVLFALVVAFVPALIVAILGSLFAPFPPTIRDRAHLVLVALLGGLAAWRMGRDITGWSGGGEKLLLLGLVVGAALAVLRWRVPTSATFLRYAGAASVIFLLQFLVMSPTSDVAFGSPTGVDDEVAQKVAADLGDDPPPVVLVILDSFPTTSLLDGKGQIDAELYPNIGELAASSTWYRNNTTNAAFTGEAVPAIMTGRYPKPGGPASDLDEKNIFTLLGGSYDMKVKEQVTNLCSSELCPREESAGLGTLVDDAVTWWKGNDDGAEHEDEFDLPSVLHRARYSAAEDWIADLDVSAGGRPDLTLLHVVLPHGAWQFTDDGTLYDPGDENPVGLEFGVWEKAGVDVGLQRHILQAQAADKLVGQLMDRLRAADVYDDSLVILTADHGEAFVPGASPRFLTPETMPGVMWTPLLVKTPGQAEAAVDDRNVEAVDVVPTIADHLGVDIPWEVDGRPLDSDPPDVKTFADYKGHSIHPEDGESYIEVGDDERLDEVLAADPVAATGPDAAWKLTAHGELFGQKVDDLRVGDPADKEVIVEELDRFDDVDTAELVPTVVVGRGKIPAGTTVAYALNGTIGALVDVEARLNGGVVQGLLPPHLLSDGANELTAYIVEGSPGDETLHPLDLTG